ncbi:polymorphic toxin type 50 domain-containing protein (plasmid) [Rhizobium leguminosarum]|uniref:polymorphic toxin type 50 domain-containing protein n=1 Tax=Rhizobium leguminosarum TaxID=384 RepID=UPI00359FD8C2
MISRNFNTAGSLGLLEIGVLECAIKEEAWEEVIGSYVDPATGEKIPTTKGIIHRGSKGVRIVPSRP